MPGPGGEGAEETSGKLNVRIFAKGLNVNDDISRLRRIVVLLLLLYNELPCDQRIYGQRQAYTVHPVGGGEKYSLYNIILCRRKKNETTCKS